ncbi:hypothetical protein [Salmonella phage PLL1]|nr:hypothetical protein [Salmonella phage PLL1]
MFDTLLQASQFEKSSPPLNYTAHSSADEPSFKTGCAEMGDCVPD